MKALIWKELREVAAPVYWMLILDVAFVGTQLIIIYRNQSMNVCATGLGYWYAATIPFALWLGCSAFPADKLRRTIEFDGAMPISRAAWWLTRFGTRLFVVAAAYALTLWVGAAADPVRFAGGWLAPGGWGIAPIWVHVTATACVFAFSFALSTVSEAAVVSAAVAILVGLGLAFCLLPAGLTPRALCLLSAVLSACALIASAYGFVGSAPLSFDVRDQRTKASALWLLSVALVTLLVVLGLKGT